MKKLLLILFALTMIVMGFALTTVTIGTGTSTGRYPLNDYFTNSRSQCIYLQSEIGVSNGLITKLRWYRNDTGADPDAIGTTEIWLTETTSATLSGTAWNDPGTLVATISDIDLGSGGGWYEIDIEDYFYAGGNLLVSVRTQDAPFASPHSYWRYTSTSPNYRMLAGNSDGTNPPTVSTSYNRPNIQMDIEPASGYPGVAINPNPANGATAVSLSGTLAWDFGADTETYELYFGPLGSMIQVDSGTVTGPSETWNYGPLSEYTSYQWQVISHNSSKSTTNGPVWHFTTLLTPLNVPVTEDFESITTAGTFPLGWTRAGTRWTSLTTVPTSNTQNRGPRSGTNYLTCQYSAGSTDWMFSRAVNLDATKTYDFGIWYNTDGLSEWTSFKMYIGTTASGSDMNTELASVLTPVNMSYTQLSKNAWTPPATGVYYIGLQVIATGGPWYMSFDDFTITETPTSAVFDISPLTWDFVDVDVNTTDFRTFTVSNIGVGSLGITSIQKTAGDVDYFQVTNNTYTVPLEAGESFTFDVEFAPTAAIDYDVTITITDDQSKATHDISITGNGYVRPAGSTCQNPYPVDLPLTGFTGDTSLYGDDYESNWVTPSFNYLGGDDMVLQFTLDVPSTLEGTLTALTGNWVGMVVVNTCPDPVNKAPVLATAISSSGTVATMASDGLPAGSYFLIISTYPSPQSFEFSLDLSAIPLPTEPEFSIDYATWDFGDVDVNTTSVKTFTVTNTAGGSLGIVSIAKTSGDMADFEVSNNTYADPLEAGQSFTFDVEFTPTTAIDYAVTVTITDDQSKATHDIIITGNGYVRPAGSTCQNPLFVDLPLTGFTGDTSLYGDDYERTWVDPPSYYINGDDMVLQFTLDVPSTLEGTLTSLTGNYIGMLVVNTCPDPETPAPVLATAVSSSGNEATMASDELPAGSYFLIISTWASPQSAEFTLDLSAIPVPTEPMFSINPSSWEYANAELDTEVEKIFTITNIGPGTLFIDNNDISIIGDDHTQFILTPLDEDISLGNNVSAEITVTFKPTSLGVKNASIQIIDNTSRAKTSQRSGTRATQSVPLTGKGVILNTVPYAYGFGDSWGDWTVVNGTQTNQWYVGDPDEFGTNAAYVSDDEGASFHYTIGSTSVVHFYQDFNFPAETEDFKLKFDWLAQGEGAYTAYDYLRVYAIESTVTPQAGTLLSSPLETYNLSSGAMQTESINLPANFAGTKKRIVFTWRNDSSGGTQPPAAVDNIRLVIGSDNDLADIDNGIVYMEPSITPQGEDPINPGITIQNLAGSGNVSAVAAYADEELPNAGLSLTLSGTGFSGSTITIGHDLDFAPAQIALKTVPGDWILLSPDSPEILAWDASTVSFTMSAKAEGDLKIVFPIGDGDTLPVTLSSFTAVLTADLYVNIAWTTESETNHSGYNILRSEVKELSTAITINRDLIDEGTSIGTQVNYKFTDTEVYHDARYYYWLEDRSLTGESDYHGPLMVTISAEGDESDTPNAPKETKLFSAFPNPFNPHTNLRYSVREAGEVQLEIYNVKGQMIRSYNSNHSQPGYYQVKWDGRDTNGRQAATGVYFYRMSNGKYTSTKKMVMTK